MRIGWLVNEMVLIFQPPNAHVRISGILLRNAMAAAAVKKIYGGHNLRCCHLCSQIGIWYNGFNINPIEPLNFFALSIWSLSRYERDDLCPVHN
jgi:hypothetical protein